MYHPFVSVLASEKALCPALRLYPSWGLTLLHARHRPSHFGDLEDAFAVGAESVVFAPVPGPGPARPGAQGGACAVLTLGTDANANIDAPCVYAQNSLRCCLRC